MRPLASLIVALLITASACAQDAHRVEAVPVERDYYADVTALLAGPRVWHDELPSPEEAGYAYRAAVVTSEVYDAVYIERVAYGPEGCCSRVVSARRLDMGALADRFGLTGELSGITGLSWPEPGAFEFTLQGRRFRVEDLGEPSVVVREG